ncbi:MAG: hypothetical protein A3H29_06530 [Acidobacteria bacterium RIFCSPLOWO2_02_FULL_67_21]|nr:MAG: hypothetical protein A3H29_06530 [Acidobacteria bacterium RIFCSPLOWO2_02_FULL_67_21]
MVALIAAAPSPAVCIADAQQTSPALKQHVDSLSSFDYATRTNAARMIRRGAPADAVSALADAVRGHADQFVRSRALVLLTGFNDPGTPDLMRSLLRDRNDRIREVVYRWFERHPDPALAESLVAALETEQSEFVRPALVRAVAALPGNETARRALLAEIGRGFDFFRSAVIEALGDYRAAYAADALAAVAALDGPLQDDAILALGRIGGDRAAQALPLPVTEKTSPVVTAALQAAGCLLGGECRTRLEWLAGAARDTARPEAARAAVAALGAVGQHDALARSVLIAMADGGPEGMRHEIAIAFSTMALRRPGEMIAWLAQGTARERGIVMDLLREGFESLEEDFEEEQFFAAARAAYWSAADESATRRVAAALINRLDF